MKICHVRTKLPKREKPVTEVKAVVSTNSSKELPVTTNLTTVSVALPTSQTIKTIGKNILKVLGILVVAWIIFEVGVFYANHTEIVNLRGGAITDMVAMINNERSKAGVAPLVASLALMNSAQAKCDDMVKNNYFAHTSPTGISPWFFFGQAGFDYKFAGENLTEVNGDYLAMSAFMNSPAHRQNILSPDYTRVGIGRCFTPDYDIIVQHFGTPLK